MREEFKTKRIRRLEKFEELVKKLRKEIEDVSAER